MYKYSTVHKRVDSKHLEQSHAETVFAQLNAGRVIKVREKRYVHSDAARKILYSVNSCKFWHKSFLERT